MINGGKVLAVIPARGGSKRTQRKNIKDFRGKPLIAWTLEVARESQFIDRTVFSTEDPEIKQVAVSLGAEVIDRLQELATDTAANEDVMRHALSVHPNYEWVVLLQPTSPLRIAEDIDACIRLALEKGASVSCCRDYNKNGAVYVMHSAWLMKGHNFHTRIGEWYVMPDERSLDIDYEWQLRV